jgi:hypothetical protein
VGSITPWVGPKNESTLIGVADLSKLQKADNAKIIVRAEHIRSKCEEIGKNVQGQAPSITEALCMTCGIRLVHLVFSKKDQVRGRFATMQDIGSAFIKELSDVSCKPLVNPFEVASKAPAPAPSGASVSGRVQDLHKMGIVNEALVIFKKQTLRVESIDESVKLFNLESKARTDVDIATFLKGALQGLYKVKVNTKQNESDIDLTKLQVHDVLEHFEVKKLAFSSQHALAMIALSKESSACMRLGKLKPTSVAYHVLVDKDLRAKELCLAPTSTSLNWVERKESSRGAPQLVLASLTHPLSSQMFDLILPIVFMKPVTATTQSDRLRPSAQATQGFTSFFNMVMQTIVGQENVHLEKSKKQITIGNETYTATIPYFTNQRIIKKGTFLQRSEHVFTDYPEPSNKRAKTE